MIYRLGLPLVVSIAQFVAAIFALGRPDSGSALAFLGSGRPTVTETLSALQFLVWAIVLLVVCGSLGMAFWELAHRAAASPRRWEAAVLVVGVLILVVGALHHLAHQVNMYGGSVEEAQGVLGR